MFLGFSGEFRSFRMLRGRARLEAGRVWVLRFWYFTPVGLRDFEVEYYK